MNTPISKSWERELQTYYKHNMADCEPLVAFLDHPQMTKTFLIEFAVDYAPWFYGASQALPGRTGDARQQALARKIINHPQCSPDVYDNIIHQLRLEWWGDDPMIYSHFIHLLQEERERIR